MSQYSSAIIGTGSYFPKNKVTNDDLSKKMDTSHDWIVERTGIHSRHYVADEDASDLAMQAASRAIEESKVAKEDIDMIILATLTPDKIMPNTACIVQHKLGLKNNCMALDISAACTGFVYALSIADQYIRNGMYKTILVIGAEVLSPFLNFDDRGTAILFGDGAGAAVVRRSPDSEKQKISDHHLHSNGSLGDLLTLPSATSYLRQEGEYLKMKGKELFKVAVSSMQKCAQEVLQTSQLNVDDISWAIPHQANTRIMDAVAKSSGIPREKVINEIHDMGNTSSATIPVALDRAVRDGRIQRGQWILLVAFGAGVTSGGLLVKY